MITQSNLLLLLITCSSYLLINRVTSSCTPSACGIIPNISSPFRLKHDPKHCGDHKYELACDNNVTTMYINSHRYDVKAINYNNFTIRLADVSINANWSSSSICSFNPSSAFEYSLPFSMQDPDPYSFAETDRINFMSCPYPLHNFSTWHSDCDKAFNSSHGRHTYIKFGDFLTKDVDYMCTVYAAGPTSWNFTDMYNVSLSEVHQSLLYGFELSWIGFLCRKCGGAGCSVRISDGQIICSLHHSSFYYNWEKIMHSFQPPDGPTAGCLMILMLIVAILFAGVSIPAKIIIGFGASYWVFVKDWWHPNIQRILVVSFEVRFIVGIICGMCFLIYKFRKRHMSMYDAIEGFLQSDNKLTPIRYTYSDLKKMTKGFREKLGEGGFGSVYKGKLRSGHDVAVKVLGKPKENGQDFINEIATIGRIHHVNVVKLVGYCAERSKRALVFDFMPNGSLERYIFSREETNCLEWDVKFNIAVGVSQGIEYLHRGCDIQILHFDIKPHNILLDDKFVPKVSDFGLAKLCSVEKDNVTLTMARGTIGYVAPELINRSIGGVSYKADVYSFGMLLMEMIGLNRDLIGHNDDSSKYFPHWIYDHFNQGRDIEIGKANKNNANDEDDSTRRLVRKMTIVALWCIQLSPDHRPSMNKVLKMLEGDSERLRIPDYPSQSIEIAVNVEQTGTTCSTDDSVSFLRDNEAAPIINVTTV